MGTGDCIALLIISAALVCAVIYMIKGRKNNRCGGCPYAGECGREVCERKKGNDR